ncbi:heparinase II/III-like protein [Chitinophaga dinghuensis]|uniref:Heparinase II/III-like protein n=1 Tax=Chitinophaga dinghuensis TaxID=1539050 RepID=A0A327W420_9BACT|nr:heparinase II/III family protein [Chitinophaga dinghuensis]RAJ83120.1 heparinase II/III-like protein [Chitinophaga dinghuensis]
MRFKNSIFHVMLVAGVCVAASVNAQQSTPHNYLENAWKQAGGTAAFSQTERWRTALKQQIAAQMEALSPAVKQGLIADAEKAMKFTWPALTADLYLQYRDNGNRSNFEAVQGERRRVLAALIAGEMAEKKGRFIPQIGNGLWLILEESTWVLPAHVGVQKMGTNLPDPAEEIIDLVAGETAITLGWTQFLLREELDKFSVMINRRIDAELDRRIYTPYLQRNDYWWMGFKGGQVNNWNIWVNTNIMKTALLNLDDAAKRGAILEKSIRSSDNFVNAYGNDGGCDEGPSYWGHAGGKLIELLDNLNSASNQQLNFSKNELMHAIGAYIYKMHVDSNRFVNFADASARSVPPPHDVYLYGKMFQDTLLTRFGAYLYRLEHPDMQIQRSTSIANFVFELLLNGEMRNTVAAAPYTDVNWLPDLQVLSLRARKGTPKGMFFAAQGGHNAESHNHNDVGNFVLYLDGEPAIIDVGVGTYTKQTFSKDRYKLWYMQSQWHNCPTINGVMQQDGRTFRASNVQFTRGKDGSSLAMDIATAYPATAGVSSWKRYFSFSPQQQQLKISEDYELKEWKEPFRIHFMTATNVDAAVPGKVVLKGKTGNLVLTYDPALFTVQTEAQAIDDVRLSSVWGNSVTRISLVPKQQKLKGSHSFTFRKE